MLKVIEEYPKIGIVGPRIIEKNGQITPECKRNLPTIRQDFLNIFLIKKIVDVITKKIPFLHKKNEAYYRKSENCECLLGCCLLMKRELYKLLKGFDESIPMYLDDLDLCYKSRKKGYENYYYSDSTIIHIGQHSTNKNKNYKIYDVLKMQASLYFYKKHFGSFTVFIYKIMVFLSIPYLLSLDVISFPHFLYRGRPQDQMGVVKKHLGYFNLIFFNRVGV